MSSKSPLQTKKKGFTMPHTFVILVVIILIAVVLTWIIPSGEYARVEDLVSGKKVVDATSFSYVENVRVSLLAVPMLIINAFSANADLITLILLSGGAIHMLTAVGALQALVAAIVRRFSNRVEVFIPLLMLVFGLICTTQGVNTSIGFATGTLNVSTTLVAQKIAELPNYSGIGYRWICFAVFYVVTCLWLVRYAKKIQKNPELSPMYDLDKTSEFKNSNLDEFGTLDTRKILCIVALVVALVAIVYGCIKLDWDFAEQSAVFLVLGIVVGILGGFDANKICTEFMNGTKKMLTAAFIIMFARAIGSVLSAGLITDTIVHAMAVMLTGLPSALLGVGMLVANTLINVVLTSGSGQAAAVMPIMIPLSDLLGVTRQTCILSFNFGDGFCNYILPTSTALMGILGAANVPYDRWMRFMWKLFAVWMAVGAVLVVVAQLINYGPM